MSKRKSSKPQADAADLAEEAHYGKLGHTANMLVARILETYHARLEKQKREKARYDACVLSVNNELAAELKGTIDFSKPIPEPLLFDLGRRFIQRMRQRFKSRQKDQELPFSMQGIILESVVNNKPQFFSDLAKAVKRIHGKGLLRGQGPTFKITPSDPALLHLLETAFGGTPSVSNASVRESVFDATGIRISRKKAQRLMSEIGITPDKGGRPRKPKMPAMKSRQSKQPSMAAVKRAAEAFLSSRKKR